MDNVTYYYIEVLVFLSMSKNRQLPSGLQKARSILLKQRGIFRTTKILELGVHPRILYQLRDTGEIEQVDRGVFRLIQSRPISHPDLMTIAIRCPQSVICMVSALAFHEITTQIPHKVSIAIKKGAEIPKIQSLPIEVHHFSDLSFNAGIKIYKIDGMKIRIYNLEKTIADCFKFRNQIGMDIVLEALKLYMSQKKFKPNDILEYARICRVEKIIKPYLEAMV